jgi:hypothetical protein
VIDSDGRLRAAYKAFGADAPGTPHPPPEAIAAAVERSGAESDRLATLDHVGSCARCREEFELLWVTHTAARQVGARRWPIRQVGLAAAAVVVVGVALSVGRWRSPSATGGPDRGAPTSDPGHTITLVAPLGAASPTAPRFVWHAVPTTSSYRLEVLDDSGAVIVGADTRDTSFTARALTPGRSYRWWVQTKVNGEVWQSEFAEIHATPTGT